jgi:hypothetical protein
MSSREPTIRIRASPSFGLICLLGMECACTGLPTKRSSSSRKVDIHVSKEFVTCWLED